MTAFPEGDLPRDATTMCLFDFIGEAAPPKLLLLPAARLLQPPRQQTMERADAASPAEDFELIPAAQLRAEAQGWTLLLR
jgi:hypothetical protein